MGAGSFALPIHSDELGRLPLHPGFNMPPAAAESPMGTPRNWYAPNGSQHAPLETMPRVRAVPDALGEGMPAHMNMPSMFAMGHAAGHSARGTTPGAVYDELLATIQGGLPPPPGYVAAGMPPSAMGDAGAGAGELGAGGEHSYADSNTLAMWSVAPSGFE